MPGARSHRLGRVEVILAILVIVGLIVAVWFGVSWFAPRLSAGPAPTPRAVTARGDLSAQEQTTISIFQAASPSVVYINTLEKHVDPWTLDTEEARGTGSGFIWDNQGHIVTNYHVVQGAASAEVVLADQTSYRAQLVGTSPDNDIAVLLIKAPSSELPPLPLGTSTGLKVGQMTYAIGNPFGLSHTLTTGVVSSLDRRILSLSGRPIEDVIQTDAAINPGNSGGPLLDSAGLLIGMNMAIYSPSGAWAGIGFAVPVDTINRVVPRLIASGKYAAPVIGVRINDEVGQRLLQNRKLQGVLVLEVVPDSPADDAGVHGTSVDRDGSISLGDIIQQIDDSKIQDSDDLYRALDQHQPGDQVRITIWRNGTQLALPVQLQ